MVVAEVLCGDWEAEKSWSDLSQAALAPVQDT